MLSRARGRATTMTRFHFEYFLIDFRSRKPESDFGGNGALPFLPGLCLSRKNATLDKFRNKRKVGCTLLHKDARLLERGGRRKREKEREGGEGGLPKGWPRLYRERVEPRKNHKSSDLPVTLRTGRLLERRSTKMMKCNRAVLHIARLSTQKEIVSREGVISFNLLNTNAGF